MIIKVDTQYVSQASQLPNIELFTHWTNTVLANLSSHIIDAHSFESKEVEMTIRVVDEYESSQLNEKWRQRKGATNVLSFPFEPPPNIIIPLLGDLVICAPLVIKEAQIQNKLLNAHWSHLVVHGTLHLFGYDHISKKPAQVMEDLEIQILSKLGYPNPYSI